MNSVLEVELLLVLVEEDVEEEVPLDPLIDDVDMA